MTHIGLQSSMWKCQLLLFHFSKGVNCVEVPNLDTFWIAIYYVGMPTFILSFF